MQIISSFNSVGAMKEREQNSIITLKILQFFNHISTLRQKSKNLVGNFLSMNMRSLYAKFQPSSFKTEGGYRG